MTSVTNGSNNTTTSGSSSGGSTMLSLPTSVTANGTTVNNSYDAKFRISETSIADTAKLGYTYSNGNLTSVTRTDMNGTSGTSDDKAQTYSFTYDAFGNRLTTKVGSTTLSTNTYAARNGLLTQTSLGNGDSFAYTYDSLGRLVLETREDGGTLRYEYTGDGSLHRTVQSGTANNIQTQYTYDSLGRLISCRVGGQSSANLWTQNAYNEKGQLTSYYAAMASLKLGTAFTYGEKTGNLTKAVYTVNGTSNANTTFTLTYDNLQRITKENLGPFYRNLTYKDINSSRTTMQVASLAYSNSLGTFNYTYDNLGRIASYTTGGVTQNYTYDSQGQLLTAGNYSYTYDKVGNITTISDGTATHNLTYTNTNWRDLLTGYDGHGISYDTIGNPTSYYNGSRYAFTWSNGRQLSSAEVNGHSVTYNYHMNGLRTNKYVDGDVHYYLWEGDRLVKEYANDNAYFFIYDPSGRPYMFLVNAAVYFYITNLQGDVVKIVDANRNVVASYTYDPYGKVLSATGTLAAANPLRYRGYYFDSETSLYYLQSRYYDPQTGRFINADDAGYLGADGSNLSYNLFAYCQNDPVNRADSGGNWSGWATAGVAIGAALCIAAVTVLTCGVGTATLVGAVAVGAAKGALIGAAVGTAAGAGVGYAVTGTLEGAATGAAIGLGAGAVIGAAVGASAGANSWYNARALEFTNAGSNEVVLGRSGTYDQVAQSRGSTYFHTSDARWEEVHDMVGVGNKGMWRINKAFLDQQISAGHSFVLSNNPITDGGYYFAKEVEYLVSKGIGYSIL